VIAGSSRPARRCAALLVVVAGALAARTAAAHPLDLGYLRLDGDGRTLAIALDLDAGAAAHLLGLGERTLYATTLRERAGELADATIRRGELASELGVCWWTGLSTQLRERTASLALEATCPSGSRTLRWQLPFLRDPRVASTFQLLVKARLAGAEHVTTLDRDTPELVLTADQRPGFAGAVWSRIERIGPDGLAHALLLLALVLAGRALLRSAAGRPSSPHRSRSGDRS
jgi:hypothetical protein